MTTEDAPLEDVYFTLVEGSEPAERRGAMMVPARVTALVGKELAELARNKSALLPVLAVALVSMVLPFFIGLAVPRITGDRLSSDADLVQALAKAGEELPRALSLPDESAVQAFVFHRFLTLAAAGASDRRHHLCRAQSGRREARAVAGAAAGNAHHHLRAAGRQGHRGADPVAGRDGPHLCHLPYRDRHCSPSPG